MWQIFIGSLLLSVIHALIPHHWIPVIAIAKSEKWTSREAIGAALITGLSHMVSTIIIGIIVGFVGIKLSESYSSITHIAAPTILLVIGIIYFILDMRAHAQSHSHYKVEEKKLNSKTAILGSLALAMFLTPCIEIEAYYFQAANYGWTGIITVSSVYLVMTLLFTSLLVYLGLKGVRKLNLSYLENHSKRITGMVLIILGIVAYFVEF